MKAFGFTAYGGPEVAAVLEVPAPVPGPGEVLVDLRAAGVNPADIKVRSGERQGVIEVRFPMAMGREAAGVVVAVGEGVSEWRPGDEVFGATASGTGALAEQVLLEASATARRPATLGWEQAACLPVSAGTAFDALHELDLGPGQVLLVLGAGGGVGTSVIPLAVARGIRVIGVASAAKEALVSSLGAEHVRSGVGWDDRVRSLASGGVDALFDLVGGQVLPDGAGLLRSGRGPVSIASPGLATELGGGGVTRRRTTEVFDQVAELAASGVLDIHVSAAFPLHRAAEAVALVESGHATGKVVVVPDRD
ncbi:MAG: NADP-dependent oxidoreductase [Nocardioidaceae bacterium]